MRYLAIDYGLRRVGLAICDAEEIIVSPLCLLANDRLRPEVLLDELKALVEEHAVAALVIGLPLNMDDNEGEQAKLTRLFADKVKDVTGLPVYFQDERLSSMAADELLEEAELTKKRRKEKRDMLAACAILQDFLDRKQRGEQA